MDVRELETPEGLEKLRELHRSKARPGVRKAVICALGTEKCNWRSFDPDAKCPEHGGARVQANRPYLGVPTT